MEFFILITGCQLQLHLRYTLVYKMSETSPFRIQFVPFSSTVSPGFWYELANRKIDVFKLSDAVQNIKGFYSSSDASNISCRHSIEYNSFDVAQLPPPLCQSSHGQLFVKNTIEEFKEQDKRKLVQSQAQILWDDITSGNAIQHPSQLVRFCLLCFIDLKKYHFHYWFAFPSFLHSTDNVKIVKSCSLEHLGSDLVESLTAGLENSSSSNEGFFLVSFDKNKRSTFHKLSSFSDVVENGQEVWFGFCDPSALAEYPGWPLRNFLVLIIMHWAKKLNGDIKVLCLHDRSVQGIRSISQSLFLHLNVEERSYGISSPCLDGIGWERNKNNKLGPRFVNMAETMDPIRLAESAVDLNLKLMRWRLMPNINLDKISNSKCLLLGAGTLGCNVARCLLGWGVRKISLLDNSCVSFSNPVRQTLFEFSDCAAGGGRPKAVAAAERLKKIFPGVDANGINLSIPMPGHPVNTNEKTRNKAKEDIVTLTDAISNHDVVFLLMDSRESRWLPTLIASAQCKLVINAALGFDSYLVMRHGIDSGGDAKPKSKLGCYFCNDVVAPGNSMKDRTLDQQCTVSRPGVSMIAAALAAELFVSVTQHRDEAKYLPENDNEDNRDEFPLGKIPHQIRGYLSHYQTLLPTTYSFTKCTACSDKVISEYRKAKIDFLMQVFNSPPHFLEDITGLTQLHQETALAEDEILEFSDTESI